ncbi:transmembrane protease serine 6-like isoform X2 [Ostrinia furnacalis]|uniref:transmembrane protease serine 6-like isoform X2 n=1 Tax=Ostrinia furnacalis TaxID=93504 RepID=UPI00103B368F|nr:transmembrane protease serine 6-like isoform X2 [Ostrinia furnacalis]
MGAGQIGGIATLLDIDFRNAAGFMGTQAEVSEAQFVVHFLSHALMFCMGTLIEAHVVLTPAICVFGERYKFEVYGGTHKFLEHAGISRTVQHLCIHKGYNHTMRWKTCASANLGLLVLSKQFSFHQRESGADYVVNRLRYGLTPTNTLRRVEDLHCRYYGWGSRRNGYLIPLSINLRRLDVHLLPPDQCTQMWNYDSQFLCIQQKPCKDDLGSVIECSGFAVGMMISRLVDRPCGVGFLDLSKHNKFLTCGVDDARDVIDHDAYMSFDFTTFTPPPTPSVITVPNSPITEH